MAKPVKHTPPAPLGPGQTVRPAAVVAGAQPWYTVFKIQAFIVGLLAIIFYANTYQNEIAFDDNVVIVKNEYVLEGFAGIHDLLTHDGYESYYRQFNSGNQLSGGRYRPLSLLTFAIEQQFFGAIPASQVDSVLHQQMTVQLSGAYGDKMLHEMHLRHLFNILWFTLSVIVLLYFLRYIVFRQSPLMAFIAAILFTIHPIHTEVVANVKSRDEILSLLFICLTFICAFKYREKGKKWLLVAALASYFLAYLSKEYAVALVGLLPLAFYLFNGLSIRKSVTSSIPYFSVTLIYILIRLQIVQPAADNADQSILNNPYAFASGSEKLATEITTSVRYLKLLVYPHPLSYDYSYNQIPYHDFSSPLVWLSIAFYIGLIAAGVYTFRKRHVLSFAIAFYLLNLLLVCNILFDIGATMGERLIYHSSVGFVIALAWALAAAAEKIKPVYYGKATLSAIMLALIGVCAYATIVRNKDWKNNLTLSYHDLGSAPNSILINANVATALMNNSDAQKDSTNRNKDLRQAINLFGKVISIYPAYDKAYVNRALGYFRLGVLDSVLVDLNKARTLNAVHPQLPDIYYNLGIAFSNNKEYDNADSAWAITLALNPGYSNARAQLTQLRTARMQADNTAK